MDNDSYLTIVIIFFMIGILLSNRQIRFQSQTHFAILLFIIFLFYTRNEKSAFMTSVLYLIVYLQSYKKNEYFSSSGNLPNFSLTKTINPDDKIAESILINNNLPSQITSWFTGDSFDSSKKEIHWRDLASNNHIYFTASSSIKLNSSSNKVSGPQKWISGDITSQLVVPLPASSTEKENVTFVHLTRYHPRTSNRGKIWSSSNGTWVSGYNDNKITVSNMDGNELVGTPTGQIMNIQGSNWNLFIDQMDIGKKQRTVLVNGSNYVFQNSMSQQIPDKIGLNINSGEKTDWECAEIMVYPRILDSNEIQQINQYFNKKYSIQYPEKIEANKYNIYNHYTFSSTPDSDWQSPPSVGATKQSGNKLLGITDSEYECVSLCDKNTTSCAAFSYHMEKGICYSVNEQNILNHTAPNKVILSGTNRVREDIAQKAKEEAERKAREEAARIAREKAEAAAAAAAAHERWLNTRCRGGSRRADRCSTGCEGYRHWWHGWVWWCT